MWDCKKLFVLITALLISTSAHANTISLATISADSTVGTFNTNFSTIANWANGNVEGSTDGSNVNNIKADSIYEINMADDANGRLRDSELLSITVDTTAVQATFVYTGLVPPTDVTLTSTISAGTAYINGYRVAKGATSNTYTASKDTYVDLGQNGSYTFTAVANGAAAPTVAANSARVAKVVTSGTAITSVTDLANRRLPGLVVPANYRSGMTISRDTTTTMIVTAGTVEINNTMVSKTSATTLTLNTAGDWAGGSSLQAVSTYGFVGIDSAGNLKMHTTAPAYSNYAVSNTVGTLRYATWSSTVYRIIGWFYMNSTGSGQLDTYGVGGIRADGVPNVIRRDDNTSDTINDTAYGADLTNTTINFYTSGNPIRAYNQCSSTAANWLNNDFSTTVSLDSAGSIYYERMNNGTGTTGGSLENSNIIQVPQGTHTIVYKAKVNGSDDQVGRKSTIMEEL